MRLVLLLLAIIPAVAINLAIWALPNQPVTLAPLPEGKLQSVSYAPFRDGQSPLSRSYPTREQMGEDLRLLSAETRGIRTYTSLEGMEVIPALARRHGLTVTMGAWLDWLPAVNEREVDSLIRLANQYPDTITRVIVGNESLLRGSFTADQLIPYLDRVRSRVKQPVTYADVWEFWLKNPSVADHVDFITIHILPYWEDIPAGVDKAEAHLLWVVSKVRERFPGKPLLIGEIGWPTAGRMRGPAMPGLANKARFINTVVRVADREGFDYNIIEAFDQSWKIHLEGTVGGHWGLFSADRERKFLLAGPVVEMPNWLVLFGLATGLGLASLLLVLRWGPMPAPLETLGLAVLTQGLGSALVLAAAKSVELTYYPYDQVLAWTLVVVQAVVAFVALTALRHERRGESVSGGAVVGGMSAMLVLSLLALIWTLLLVVDGRYRDFPMAEYLVSSAGVAVLALYRWLRDGTRGGFLAHFALGRLFGGSGRSLWTRSVGGALTALLAIGAVAVMVVEGPENIQAWVWAGQLLILALINGATAFRSLPPPPLRTA